MASRKFLQRAAQLVGEDEEVQAAILCIPTWYSGVTGAGGDLHAIISTQRRHLLVHGAAHTWAKARVDPVLETATRDIVLGPPRGIIFYKIDRVFERTMYVHRVKWDDVRRADRALTEMRMPERGVDAHDDIADQ
jgi:hypothetical protein